MVSTSSAVQKLLDRAVLCSKQAEEHRRQTIVHRDGYLLNAKLAGEALNAAIKQAEQEAGQTRGVAGPIREEFCKQAQVKKSAAYNYRLVAEHWNYLQDQQPLPDSITQCLKLISGLKDTRSGRHRNYMVWKAEQRLKKHLHELWTSEATPSEKADRTRELNAKYHQAVERWGVPPRKPGTGCMADSGAFTLNKRADKVAEKEPDEAKKQLVRDAYYDSPDTFEFMNEYAGWVKRNIRRLEFYANLDVIGDAERTWRNQRYLEDAHGLKPMPVVHAGTDLKWLHHHIDHGYRLIGFGGLKGRIRQSQQWLTEAFNIVCDTPDRMPKVDVHGFGVSQIASLYKFPFYSVDFTTWSDLAENGIIAVPPWKDGEFVFDQPFRPIQVSKGVPNQRKVSDDGEDKQSKGPKTYDQLSPEDQEHVQVWLDQIDVYFGRENVMYGVSTDHSERREANLRYFEEVRKRLPEYPWAFRATEAVRVEA